MTTILESTTTATHRPGQTPTPATAVGFSRILQVELRKLFATNANRALMAAIFAVGVLGAVLSYSMFSIFQEMGESWYMHVIMINAVPIILLQPLVILMVTTEWSTRSAMTTFTLEPRRHLVIAAKAIVTVLAGIVVWALSLGLGAGTYAVGTAMGGTEAVWSVSATTLLGDLGAQLLMTLSSFALALLIHNAPATIVLVLALPTVIGMSVLLPEWAQQIVAWINLSENLNITMMNLTGAATGQHWAQLAVSVAVWVIVPGAVGIWRTLRREAV